MTKEEQKVYDDYLKEDVDIEDLIEQGWACLDCQKKSPRSKLECSFTDCLEQYVLSGKRQIKGYEK